MNCAHKRTKMSLKYTAIIALSLLTVTSTQEVKRQKYEDPFALLDKHITHTLAHHYLWPWSQLIKAATAMEDEDHLEEPQLDSDPTKFEVNMNVKRFKPEELKIKVNKNYILVEGRHKESNDDRHKFVANHFVQRFVLPAGCNQDEVSAVLKPNGVLSITAPKHELPPPPPEREVPIIVLLPEETTTKKVVETTTAKKEEPVEVTEKFETTPKSVDLELTEATTHVGKIRKKELKTSPKTTKDNEVAKGVDENGLDYALLEATE